MPDPRSFFRELRRRKVYHVGAAYVIVGLGVLGAAELILDPLGLAAARPFVVVFVLLGFPVALVLAWAYEVRPEEGLESKPSGTTVAASFVTGVEGGPMRSRAGRDLAGSRSIAVLPFENMSPAPESEYFADGISEELTHALVRMEDLRVAARTSAFAFKGQRTDVREIGRRLGVSYVVEGSVRRAGGQIRVTAQLVDTETGYHLWSERFDRSLDDVFVIQDEIVEHVAHLLLTQMKEPVDVPVLPRARGMHAYDAYLRARHAYRSFQPALISRAVDEVERAIELDPHYAPAHASLAQILVLQAIGFGTRAPRTLMERAGKAAERALELDPTLPEPHLARGIVLMFYEWRYVEARRELERALELGPSLADAHTFMELYWTYVEGDRERALASADRALRLSPLDPSNRSRRGTVLLIFGALEAAEAEFRSMLAEGMIGPLPYLGLSDTLVRAGRLDEAVVAAERSVELGAESNAVLGVAASALGLAGHQARARELVGELEARYGRGEGSPFFLAVGLAALDQIDRAFELLDHAVDERDSALLYLSALPRPLGFHDDPRFRPLFRRVGLGHLVAERH